jgi:hypothetical protein
MDWSGGTFGAGDGGGAVVIVDFYTACAGGENPAEAAIYGLSEAI